MASSAGKRKRASIVSDGVHLDSLADRSKAHTSGKRKKAGVPISDLEKDGVHLDSLADRSKAHTGRKRKKTGVPEKDGVHFDSLADRSKSHTSGKRKKAGVPISDLEKDGVHLDSLADLSKSHTSGKRKKAGVPISDLEKKAKDAMKNNNFLRAEYFYSEAISRFPDNAELFAGRAEARIKLENFADAVADADIATRLDSSMAKAHVRKGIAYTNLAKKSFQAAAALTPCATEIELREQVWREIQALKNRYMPVLADLYAQVCRKLDETRPVSELILLRKFLLPKMTFLMQEKSRISLTADVGRFESNLLNFFSKTVKLYAGSISLKCLELF